MPDPKRQRIRDPLHNLIEFDEGDPFERMLWRVVKTAPFQRLRRIKQLGFSELVYPGATHSRFAHSLGVFHTARHLMRIVRRYVPDQPGERLKAEAALAAALVHDVGHGPFSHAFETVGEKFGWKLAGQHESHSQALIRNGEIATILNGYSESFATMVAEVIGGGPSNVYRSVVSSQFDADRLDYVRRDRLMSGTQLAGIDFDWLMANLEVGELPAEPGEIKRVTLVLGPKALHAAEGYVLGLFQLYPTLYLHKTTRCAEKTFQLLLYVVGEAIRSGDRLCTGLPENHPITLLFEDPENLDVLGTLDDSVVMGALPLFATSNNKLVKDFSDRLIRRKLYKTIDLDLKIREGLDKSEQSEKMYIRRREMTIALIEDWLSNEKIGRVLLDKADRKPYKPIDDEGPINQIWIRDGSQLIDIKRKSPIVGAIHTFRSFNAYLDPDDTEAKLLIFGAADEANTKA